MNLVGKIFVGLILVMSIVFAAFSISVYATHTNWREEIMRTPAEVRGNQQPGYKYQLEQARLNNQRLQDERNKFELRAIAERDAKIQALSKAEAEIANLRGENDTATKELAAKEKALAENTVALKGAQDNLRNLTVEVGNLRTEIAKAQNETDTQIKRAIALADEMAVAKGQLTVLTERNQQLSMDVSKAKQHLSAFGRKLEDPVDASTIPVTGAVNAVSRTRVELSIGADDGVRIGQELDIYRGDKYVGRVKITEAQPEKAIGAILNEYMQLPIQRGDNVSSRL
jgi:hypothetical protein